MSTDKSKWLWCALLMLLVGLSAACSNTGSETANANAKSEIKKNVKPVADAEVAVIEMEDAAAFGRIVIELYPNIAPQMVQRFKTLIRQGFYDGQTFHRVSSDLGIIQAGDPLSKDNDPDNDGSGGSDLPNVIDEFSDLPFKRGTVGAANADSPTRPNPNSQNSQFFITLTDVPAFDSRYTVFGSVIEGINNASVIMSAPVDGDRPIEPIKIKRVTLQPRR